MVRTDYQTSDGNGGGCEGAASATAAFVELKGFTSTGDGMPPSITDDPEMAASRNRTPGSGFGYRHVQVMLTFLLTFLAYGIRVNLSVGIVAMTTASSPNPDVPVFADWHDKSVVLSSFFWGYILPQIGAGQLAKRYGPKWFLVVTMALCSLLSLGLPSMASAMGSKGVMFNRALQGFCQGFIFPSIHDILSHWIPTAERSRMGAFVYAGGPLGTVISMVVTGLISASWYGWPMVFYVYGIVGMVWTVAMACYGANRPADTTVSEEERAFIQGVAAGSKSMEQESKADLQTPWSAILTSLPFWAILVTHCGQNWGFWTLMTEIPSYMTHILQIEIKNNSYLSAVPYLVLWLLSFVFSYAADVCINRKLCSIGATRKIFNSIGLFIPAVALILLGFARTEEHVMVLLVVAVGVNSAVYCGFNVNHMDISHNYSGTLMGLTNCIANVFSLLAPLMVQVVVTDEHSRYQWHIIFVVAAIVYIASNLFFVLCGSGEVQAWDSPAYDASKNDIQHTTHGKKTEPR